MPTPSPATTDWVPIGPPGPGVPAGGTTGQALVKNTNSDFDTTWGAAGADLVYNGDFPANTPYTDGDVVIYNNIAYLCVTPTSVAPVAWAGGQASPAGPPALTIPYGTTLPGSPYDGQLAILVDSTTNPSYQWKFRYNAGSSSAYKWEYVGGTDVEVLGTTTETTTTTGAWFDPPSGPRFLVPRPGDYYASAMAMFYHTAANAYCQMQIWRGTVGSFGVSPNTVIGPAGYGSPMICEGIAAGVQAGEDVRVRIYPNSPAGTFTFVSRALRIQPRRVS